jgi:coenzyme F420-reducing hydrogenase delta subunit
MEIDEAIFLQLLKDLEDEIIANNKERLDVFAKSEKNCEELKEYINQVTEEITRLEKQHL